MQERQEKEMEICKENIKKYRMACNFTQKQVADAVGISRSTYAYYETGRLKPNTKMLLLLSKVFGISISKFFDTEFNPNEKKASSPLILCSPGSSMFEKNIHRIDIENDVPKLSEVEQNLLMVFRLLNAGNQYELLKKAYNLKNKEMEIDE